MRFASRLALLGAFLTLGALPSSGCRKGDRGILGKSEEATTLSVDSTDVPADFPKSVPLYPGATVVGGTSVGDNEKKITGVALHTADAPEKVAAFYKSKFGASELQVSSDVANPPTAAMGRLITFKDPASGSIVSMTIQSLGEGGTNVQINATKKL